MTYLRVAFLAVLGIALLILAFANIEPVTLRVLPREMADVLGWDRAVQVPLFLVIFAGILAGLGIGFVWEWLRETKHRSAAASSQREVTRLTREVEKLRGPDGRAGDDVLALLEGRGRAR
jgi:uncharacterized integral membrane protein